MAARWCWWRAPDLPKQRCPASRTNRGGDWHKPRNPWATAVLCALSLSSLQAKSVLLPSSYPFLADAARGLHRFRVWCTSRSWRGQDALLISTRTAPNQSLLERIDFGCDGPHVYEACTKGVTTGERLTEVEIG